MDDKYGRDDIYHDGKTANKTNFLSLFSMNAFSFLYGNRCDATSGRPCSSFLQILSGTVTFDRGYTKISGKAGDFFYIPEGIRYYSQWQGTPDISFITTYHRFTPNAISTEHNGQSFFTSLDREYAFQKVEAFSNFAVAHEMQKMFECFSAPEQDMLASLAIFYQLMTQMRPYLKKESSHRIRTDILPAVSFIEKNYSVDASVREYAQMCSLSESRFFTLFKQSTGLTPTEFRNQLRLHAATCMLTSTQKPIDDIAAIVGFHSSQYFRRVFKGQYGLSPREYRKHVR